MDVSLRLRLSDRCAIGPGKIRLLEAIAKTGSISQAGRSLGMSYRRAWLLVDDVNNCFRDAVIAAGIDFSGAKMLSSVHMKAVGSGFDLHAHALFHDGAVDPVLDGVVVDQHLHPIRESVIVVDYEI